MGSRRQKVFAAAFAGVAVAACATAAPGLRLWLAHGPGKPVAGRAVSIVVRATRGAKPDRHLKVAVWIRRGRTSRSFAAHLEAAGRYRAYVVFPSAGRWKLGARAGRARVSFGSVRVRAPAVPLTFVWPTSVDVLSSRSLLVVENGAGRVIRLDPVTGKTTPVISIARAYSVAHDSAGGFYLAVGRSLLRVDATGKATPVAESDEDIGPIAVGPNGDVYFATRSRIFKVGSPTPIAEQLAAPHGLAVTGDGGLLVSDTGNARIVRVDLATGKVEDWAQVGEPRGIDIAPDRTVYVADATSDRIVHLMIDGRRLGTVGHVFGDPYAVKAAPDGSLYVVDTSAAGRLYRVAPDGKTTVVSRRG